MEPAVRRGLAFADQHSTHQLPSIRNTSLIGNHSSDDVALPFAMPPNSLQIGCAKSAFQPIRGGLHTRPQKDKLMFNQNKSDDLTPASRLLNMSSCNDSENMFQKPLSQTKLALASLPETTLMNDAGLMRETSASNKSTVLCQTPDANKSGDFNSSNLTGPSPTVTMFTKQALMEVGDMFAAPLESERDLTLGVSRNEMDQTDRDFEAAFSNDCTTRTFFSEGHGGKGRDIEMNLKNTTFSFHSGTAG